MHRHAERSEASSNGSHSVVIPASMRRHAEHSEASSNSSHNIVIPAFVPGSTYNYLVKKKRKAQNVSF
jgi:hypothetical protein